MPKRKQRPSAASTQPPAEEPTLFRSIAEDYICPITQSLPCVPVIAQDGYVYEKAALQKHFATSPNQVRSPMTNKPMSTQTTFCPFVRNNIRKLVSSKMLDVETIKQWEEEDKIYSMYYVLLFRANSGDAKAMFTLGLGHLAGRWLLETCAKRAYELFLRGSKCEIKEEGNTWEVRCMAVLGSLLMRGVGTEKDPNEALRLLHFAHERRNSYATLTLGDYYYLGKETPRNLKKALEMYEAGTIFVQELEFMTLDGVTESSFKARLKLIEKIKSHMCLRSRIVTHGP